MRQQLEVAVRDVLAERVDKIGPPPGWDARILRAAHQRRQRRRAGIAAGVVAAVAMVGLGVSGQLAGGLISPFDMAGQLAVPNLPPVAPNDLPIGPPATIPYAVGDGHAPPGDTVLLPSGRWQSGGFISTMEQVGGGFLAIVELDPAFELVYQRSDGRRTTLDRGNINGVAASADGSKVAWSSAPRGDGPTRLRLASLPDGKVLASTTVSGTSLDNHADVAAFVGDKVLLEYERQLDEHPYAQAWDPDTGRIGPLLGPAYAGTGGAVIGADPGRDTVYLVDEDSCLSKVSLAHPTTERWRSCAPRMVRARPSPDARLVAGVDEHGWNRWNRVWVRDATTGELLARREFTGALLSSLVWESPTTVLVWYNDLDRRGSTDGLSFDGKVLRCDASLRECSRVSMPAKQQLSAFSSRPGTDPPADAHLPR